MGQRKVEALEVEILQLESRTREVCIELEAGKKELEDMIAEGEERIKSIEKAKEGDHSLASLLALIILFSRDTVPRIIGICPAS